MFLQCFAVTLLDCLTVDNNASVPVNTVCRTGTYFCMDKSVTSVVIKVRCCSAYSMLLNIFKVVSPVITKCVSHFT